MIEISKFRYRSVRAFGSSAFLLIASTLSTLAEPIVLSPSGLVDPESTITFDELQIADTTRVSEEFADFGVTFLPHLYYRTNDNPDWPNVAGSNLRSGDPIVDTFSVRFNSPLSSAALTAIAQPPTPATVTAKLNGLEVESFETTVTIDNPDNYFGFKDIVFDEIEIAYTEETRMRIDNIQLGPGVGGPFQIETIEVVEDKVRLTWLSKPGETFAVEQATDLEDWVEITDGLPSEGDVTSFELNLDDQAAGAIYYRVRREE